MSEFKYTVQWLAVLAVGYLIFRSLSRPQVSARPT